MVWSLSAWALLSLPNVSLLSLKRKTSNKINICFRNSSDSQFFMKFRPLKRNNDHYSPLENTFFLIAGSRKENVLCPGMSISLLAWRHSPGWDHHMEGVLTNRLTMVSAKGLQCNGGRGRREISRKTRVVDSKLSFSCYLVCFLLERTMKNLLQLVQSCTAWPGVPFSDHGHLFSMEKPGS